MGITPRMLAIIIAFASRVVYAREFPSTPSPPPFRKAGTDLRHLRMAEPVEASVKDADVRAKGPYTANARPPIRGPPRQRDEPRCRGAVIPWVQIHAKDNTFASRQAVGSRKLFRQSSAPRSPKILFIFIL